MSKEERYAEHTVAWELPNGDSVTKSNYNLAGIETKYIPIQTEIISDDKDKRIADLEAKLAEAKKEISEYVMVVDDLHKQLSNKCDFCEEQYKQQLAEKERSLRKYAATSCPINQDKISFCIEKLEKVKNEITPIFCVPNGIYSNLHNEVFKTIDNQIKQLKKEIK